MRTSLDGLSEIRRSNVMEFLHLVSFTTKLISRKFGSILERLRAGWPEVRSRGKRCLRLARLTSAEFILVLGVLQASEWHRRSRVANMGEGDPGRDVA